MRIKKITDDLIWFNNGENITFDHEDDCCEYNYADFKQVEKGAWFFDFSSPLDFESVEGSGFRFGNKNRQMYFVPCYSEQNGCYSSDIQIYYNGNLVVDLDNTTVIDD